MTLPDSFFQSPDFASGLQALARKAGACVMDHRAANSSNAKSKADGTPVTAADHDSQRMIVNGLWAFTPDIPVVAEEKDNPDALAASGTFWLVDPLDGTREFVDGGNEFSINIALLIDMKPRIGLIYVPALDIMFYAAFRDARRIERGCSSSLKPSVNNTEPPRLVVSRHRSECLPLNDWQNKAIVHSWRPCSSAYKFGLLANGDGDLYPRRGQTSEWDSAAGDAILRAIGGGIVTKDGKPLTYGKPDFQNPDFVAFSPSCPADRLEDFLKEFAA